MKTENLTDFCVFSLGCKVNQVEGQSLAEHLTQKKFSVSLELVPATHYIINTCSVTSEADSKSRQSVARALKLNPQANIYVVGCSSQLDKTAFEGKKNVKIVGGAASKKATLTQILEMIQRHKFHELESNIALLPTEFENLGKPLTTRKQAYLKIQDGCDQYCSYCIVPVLRGKSRSRDFDEIIQEARELAESGKELVLVGINLSDYRIKKVFPTEKLPRLQGGLFCTTNMAVDNISYGINQKPALTQLVNALKEVHAKKYLGSLGINIITKELLIALKDSDFVPEFHLSIQSGSDTVLNRMNRKYTSSDIIEKVALIRKIFPSSFITADIITGFPEESETEFEETVEVLHTINLDNLHIFPYSEREGTAAYDMPQIDKAIRKERANKLKKLFTRGRIT